MGGEPRSQDHTGEKVGQGTTAVVTTNYFAFFKKKFLHKSLTNLTCSQHSPFASLPFRVLQLPKAEKILPGRSPVKISIFPISPWGRKGIPIHPALRQHPPPFPLGEPTPKKMRKAPFLLYPPFLIRGSGVGGEGSNSIPSICPVNPSYPLSPVRLSTPPRVNPPFLLTPFFDRRDFPSARVNLVLWATKEECCHGGEIAYLSQ